MRARVILYDERTNSVLLIARKKGNQQYWTIPGGGVKAGESVTQAAVREIKEELNISIEETALNFLFTAADLAEPQRIYLAKISRSRYNSPIIHGEERERMSAENIYSPAWLIVDKLETIKLQPSSVQARLCHYFFNLDKLTTYPQ
ncbi:NUDIX domain-containing protein [Lapidilactobacillus luobeiensis]|uniref:NUDIX domain-containing protein n=1 Tax=Lapidilactobacillus luobeiensis TaxID=2950371 RepID=UPI0021C4ADB8|nr:NUDIX domain-containing protein [Lapidilactobacillus luobeiensis]